MNVHSDISTLPALVDQARAALTGARTSAEVLEARDRAAVAYDAASRFTRRKAAFDHVTAVAMRLQAQALKIEARAKERLADEYDVAQECDELNKRGGDRRSDDFKVGNGNFETLRGLRRDQIHEARKIRDAERADPGAIDRCVEAALASGTAPTRAALKRDLGIARGRAASEPESVVSPVEMMRRNLVVFFHPFFDRTEPFDRGDDGEMEVLVGLRGLSADEKDRLRRAKRSLEIYIEEMDRD